MQTMASPPPPPPPLLAPSLDLDMNIYSRHFSDPMSVSCTTEMIPVPMLPPPPPPETSPFPETGLLLLEEEKSLALELAVSSMNELIKMCQANEPLWIRNINNADNIVEREILNFEEHARLFQWPLNNLKTHSSDLRTEATRDSAVVIMNSVTLVDAFLDAVKCFISFFILRLFC